MLSTLPYICFLVYNGATEAWRQRLRSLCQSADVILPIGQVRPHREAVIKPTNRLRCQNYAIHFAVSEGEGVLDEIVARCFFIWRLRDRPPSTYMVLRHGVSPPNPPWDICGLYCVYRAVLRILSHTTH